MIGKAFSYSPLRQVFAVIRVVTLSCVPGELANLSYNYMYIVLATFEISL